MAEALAEASIAPDLNGEARSMSHGVNLDHRGHARTILGAGVSQQLDLANVPDVYHAQFEVTVHASVVYVVDRSAATENRNGTSIVDDAWNFSQQVGERALLANIVPATVVVSTPLRLLMFGRAAVTVTSFNNSVSGFNTIMIFAEIFVVCVLYPTNEARRKQFSV